MVLLLVKNPPNRDWFEFLVEAPWPKGGNGWFIYYILREWGEGAKYDSVEGEERRATYDKFACNSNNNGFIII